MASPPTGFTFHEVLFSVMILGIGSILLAAMFPPAIKMTESTRDETYGSIVAHSGSRELAVLLNAKDLTSSGGAVRPLSGPSWDMVRGNLICDADPRYAFVPLYRRSGVEKSVQLFIIATKSRNQAAYDPTIDVVTDPNDLNGSPANLEPRGVDVAFYPGGNGPDLVRISPEGPNAGAAATGAFLILSNDQLTGRSNGSIFRLGEPRDLEAGLWTLQPGADLKALPLNKPKGGFAYLMGRGYVDPLHPSKGFDGPSQDLSILTTIITLR